MLILRGSVCRIRPSRRISTHFCLRRDGHKRRHSGCSDQQMSSSVWDVRRPVACPHPAASSLRHPRLVRRDRRFFCSDASFFFSNMLATGHVFAITNCLTDRFSSLLACTFSLAFVPPCHLSSLSKGRIGLQICCAENIPST